MMSEEIKAILRAEYEDEIDVERALHRLRETSERLRAAPAEDRRIRDVVEAVDAEMENEDDSELAEEDDDLERSPADAVAERDQFATLLADSERVLGIDHPEVLRVRRRLAHWTRQAGDAATARDILIALIGDSERVLGVDDPETLAIRNDLGSNA